MKTSIHRLALGLLVAGAFAASAQQAHAAAYATGGSGQYQNEILWLTWGGGGDNGTHGVGLSNGDSTSATIPVTATQDLELSCSLAGISGAIESYRPGDWSGDALDDMYNIGGTGGANQLIAGIMGRSGTHGFTVNCQATLGGAAYRIPGLVVADAESMNSNTEYLEGTAMGEWNVVEVHAGNGNNYGALKQNVSGGQSIRFGLPGGEQNNTTSPAAVAFLTFNEGAYAPGSEAVSMNFAIHGGGNTAIAIGLLAPAADFGDAPASYGDASHLLQGLVAVPDNLALGNPTNINAGGFQPGALVPPDSGFLGSTGPDGEPGSQYSDDALGDDNSGSAGPNEEDAWTLDTLTITDPAQVLNQNIVCNGTGTVAGWIDFDRNGTFDASERSAAACSGGSAALSWTVPSDVAPGRSYVRLRYASDAAEVESPIGEASDGEVEDHAFDIELEADLSLVKEVEPENAASGQEVTYTLTVGNAGPFAADGAVITDSPESGLDCPAGGVIVCNADGGAQCPATPITVGDLQGAGLTVPVLPVEGTLVLEYVCTVE